MITIILTSIALANSAVFKLGFTALPIASLIWEFTIYWPINILVFTLVTPGGSASNPPVELEDGESGFALLFPKINGVKIKKFHFFKDSKNKVFDESKLEEAGECHYDTVKYKHVWCFKLYGNEAVASRGWHRHWTRLRSLEICGKTAFEHVFRPHLGHPAEALCRNTFMDMH